MGLKVTCTSQDMPADMGPGGSKLQGRGHRVTGKGAAPSGLGQAPSLDAAPAGPKAEEDATCALAPWRSLDADEVSQVLVHTQQAAVVDGVAGVDQPDLLLVHFAQVKVLQGPPSSSS